MIIIIRVNNQRIITVLMTAYLMNVFYLNTFATAQKLFVWSLIAGYIVLNNKIASKIINRIVFGYLKKKNVIFLLLLWGIISVYSITPFSQILSEVILKKGINIEFRAFFCQLYHE